MDQTTADQYRFQCRVPFALNERLLTNKPEFVSYHNFCLHLLDAALTICYENGGMTIGSPIGPQKLLTQVPRLSVRAADLSEVSEQSSEACGPRTEAEVFGDSGQELFGDTTSLEKTKTIKTTKRPRSTGKVVPSSLHKHTELINEFFKSKGGTHNQRSWDILVRNLEQIQSKYGDVVVNTQLEQGISAKWKNITLANFEQWNKDVKPITQHARQTAEQYQQDQEEILRKGWERRMRERGEAI